MSVRRGKGLWNLNTKHLSEPAFSALINDFWTSWRLTKPSFLSLTAWWDADNARLRRHIRAFLSSKASQFRQKLSSLQNTLFRLNRQVSVGEDVQVLISDMRSDIEAANHEQTQGANFCYRKGAYRLLSDQGLVRCCISGVIGWK